MKILLIGGGDLFNNTLDILLKNRVEVVAILDQRNERRDINIPVINELKEMHNYDFDFCFACEYQNLIPKEFVKKYTIVNSHGSLLPKYRGIHGNGWAMINGETEIGYTIHILDENIDSGPIIFQKGFSVSDTDSYGEIKKKIEKHWLENIYDILTNFHKKIFTPASQDNSLATYIGRRSIRDCYIDWSRSSEFILRFIRTLKPPVAPGAFTIYKEEKFIITDAEAFSTPIYEEIPGHVVEKLSDGILVKTGDGVIKVKEVIYKGKVTKANKMFRTVGTRLGIDLISDKLKELNII